MTAKRFACDNDYYKGLILKDNLTNEILEEDGIGGYDNACDKLNELAEENEQLRNALKELKEIGDYQADRIQELNDENEQLKAQLSEAKADEKQLGISFMGYKMKLIEVLQKKYDKVKGKTLYADVYTEIAEEMGVDLE